ncbi:hypothetical protein ACOME3_007828 [Neoechinorhynchus agilis]
MAYKLEAGAPWQEANDKDSVSDWSFSRKSGKMSSSCQPEMVDIDDVVEKWIHKMWEYTKRKDQTKFRWDELSVNVNWSKVAFKQSEIEYADQVVSSQPRSRILFKTSFTNSTDSVQEYSCKAERSTSTDLHLRFTKSIRKERENYIQFKLPQEIVEAGGGIRREQTVETGTEKTYSNNVTWSVEFRVKPRCQTVAELVITEEKFAANFFLNITMSGKISVIISNRKDNSFVKFLEGDVAAIFQDTLRSSSGNFSAGNFEIHKNSVICKISGNVELRYGVEQHIAVKESPTGSLVNLKLKHLNTNNLNGN